MATELGDAKYIRAHGRVQSGVIRYEWIQGLCLSSHHSELGNTKVIQEDPACGPANQGGEIGALKKKGPLGGRTPLLELTPS